MEGNTGSLVHRLDPRVLRADLRLLLRREIIGDVELLANLPWRPALDHRLHLGAPEVEQRPECPSSS